MKLSKSDWARKQLFGVTFASIVQEGRVGWKRQLEHVGFELIEDLETNLGVDGFICSREDTDTSVIAFRGTEVTDDIIDVWIDASFWLVPCEIGGHVHKGFSDAYESIRSTIEKCKPLLKKNVVIVGHSLGGAMAQFCHVLSFHDHENCYSVSYAGPKIGTKHFWRAVKVQDRMLKVVFDLDIVPRIPNGAMGYREPQTCNSFWIRDIPDDTKRKKRINTNHNFDIIHIGWNTNDHSLVNYEEVAVELASRFCE